MSNLTSAQASHNEDTHNDDKHVPTGKSINAVSRTSSYRSSDSPAIREKDEKQSSSATTTTHPQRDNATSDPPSTTTTPPLWRRIYDTLFWVPPNCRWNPLKPPQFSMYHNVMFAFAGAFTVANLYYSHPILNILARDFNVSYVQVSQIPTLAQAGYATGLLFLCPLGDLVRRRQFVLSLVFFTATLCIGLCVTNSVAVFSAIQFITAVTTVTPQLMMPLVGDLAPPNKRAAALSIVTSGLMLGILLARLLSGIVTQYTSWRVIYWLSVGLQYLIFALLWLFMPDYPSTNPGGLNYFKMLWSIVVMLTKHPVLVQACLISYFVSATFTNYWTVLTFLLAGPPYHYDPVTIGLFALIGIAAMCFGPLWAKHITDRFVPHFTVVLGILWCLLGITIGTYTGEITIAGPILQALFQDFGMQTSQIANRSAIFVLEPNGRNRVNTAFMIFTFLGQLTGTSVGSRLFAEGGWVASGSFSVGSIGMALIITLLRGPWEEGWIGWHGGLSILKKNRESADGKQIVDQSHLRVVVPAAGKGVDEEKGGDGHEHRHGRDDQEAVNATVAEKALELRAGEDEVEDDEKASSKSKDDEITAVSGEQKQNLQ